MNKNEFIAAIGDNKNLEKFNLSKAAVAALVDAMLETIQNVLAKDEEVRLIGFGNFYVTKRAALKGRNPRTGEDIDIKASKKPKFTPGKLLKDVVNGEKAKK